MVVIKCPECNAEATLSLLESQYQGPWRCWKCRALFAIQIVDNEVASHEPLSQEEFEKHQQIQALRARMKQQD